MKVLLPLLLSLLSGCTNEGWFTIATTTSLYDSGFLDTLLPPFEREERVRARVIPVGSGQALRLGRDGNADLLLVHSPEEEEAFMKEGFGRERVTFMKSRFIPVGPEDSPLAADRTGLNCTGLFKRIAREGLPFVSRGDSSGTHMKELEIWKRAGIEPGGEWYIVSGSGMATTFRVALERGAVTLIDIATFAKLRKGTGWTILTGEEEMLENPYSALIPEKSGGRSLAIARRFIEFLKRGDGKRMIEEFTIDGISPFLPVRE